MAGEITLSSDGAPIAARLEAQCRILGNVNITEALFDRQGNLTQFFRDVLATLPIQDSKSGASLSGSYQLLRHNQIEELLQAAFFRPNEAKFSYQVSAEGEQPTDQQIIAFNKLGMIAPLTVPPGSHYDMGAIFGGLLSAVDSRTRFMLQQNPKLSSIALLGGQRTLIEREVGENLAAVIGSEYYTELETAGVVPKTEFEMMKCVWESYCRRDDSLRAMPLVMVDSKLRIGKIKEAPGTPDTVVDLANTLMSGLYIPGLETVPRTFLLSSSQPHAVRQREDFLSAMVVLNYPSLETVDVIGYENTNTPSLKLFATELAKVVHAQFLTRY